MNGDKTMIDSIIDLYNFIKKMNEDIKNNRKDIFNTYVDDVYQKANIVLKNYMDIFSLIRINVQNENWGAKEVISYIESVEYEHKDMRIYLRTLPATMSPPGRYFKDEYENFLENITHILICKTGFGEHHTLLGFVDRCRKIALYDLEEQQHICEEANLILKYLEFSWEQVCISYNKIKSELEYS